MGRDYHFNLLRRASVEVKDLRPSIIRKETFSLLDELRGYHHKFRHIYLYLISAEKIKELALKGIESFEEFKIDIERFKDFLLTTK